MHLENRRGRGRFGLLACMLLMAGPVAAGWPSVKLPEQSKGEYVSQHMKFNGLDMQSSHFVTLRPLDEVIDFYAGQWLGEHVVDKVQGKTIVGHVEGDYYVTVELREKGGGTEGTIGILKMPGEGEKPNLGEGFYRPSGTEVLSDITYLDTPSKARTLVLRNELSPYVNQQHYAQHLQANGWRSVDAGSCKPSSGSCVARFDKARGGRMTLTITRGQGTQTDTVVTLE